MDSERAWMRLRKAVLRYVASEMDEPHAHYDAELEYCQDMVLQAARDLIAETP